MARQLKRWESPRREGRNAKGKGGSARQRQLRKQFQALRKKLKAEAAEQRFDQPKLGQHTGQPSTAKRKREEHSSSRFRFGCTLGCRQTGCRQTAWLAVGFPSLVRVA